MREICRLQEWGRDCCFPSAYKKSFSGLYGEDLRQGLHQGEKLTPYVIEARIAISRALIGTALVDLLAEI